MEASRNARLFFTGAGRVSWPVPSSLANPKPLRSKANAIINLMGAVGGILYLGVTAVLYPTAKTKGLDQVAVPPTPSPMTSATYVENHVVTPLYPTNHSAMEASRNARPMVVEMCRGSDVGKFTGYYYTASMLAQVVTPVLAWPRR